jgi:hypothetical protein
MWPFKKQINTTINQSIPTPVIERRDETAVGCRVIAVSNDYLHDPNAVKYRVGTIVRFDLITQSKTKRPCSIVVFNDDPTNEVLCMSILFPFSVELLNMFNFMHSAESVWKWSLNMSMGMDNIKNLGKDIS